MRISLAGSKRTARCKARNLPIHLRNKNRPATGLPVLEPLFQILCGLLGHGEGRGRLSDHPVPDHADCIEIAVICRPDQLRHRLALSLLTVQD